MAYTDIAKRVYDHNWKLDPIIRSLMDTDFYKFLMLNLINQKHPQENVSFKLINRTKSVRIADFVSEQELRDQLDHARTLRFDKNELIWLAGNTFYGQRHIFPTEMISWLENFQLPEYELDVQDGQFILRFGGDWRESTMWEIPALSIINELRSRKAMQGMSRFEIDVIYSRAKSRLWDKVERLRKLANEGPLSVADFGTRRRHSYLWQSWAVEALMEGIGKNFIGTSNTKLAMDLGIEAIGTNAHELPMVYAAMAKGDDELLQSPYKVMEDWMEIYGYALQVILPDAYGTTGFLKRAPQWVSEWKGARPDSKPPIPGAKEFIEYWKMHGQDPKDKLVILSDGMDIDTIENSVRALRNETNVSIGWGTNLTNDFSGCAPNGAGENLKAISLVCKVSDVNGRPAVKLSDNPTKATGDENEVKRYLSVFGGAGMFEKEVSV